MKRKIGVYDKVTVTLTPSAAMMKIYGVLNKLPYPNVCPLCETAEKIARVLGWECDPLKAK